MRPGVAGAVMRSVPDAVERRIAHVDVRRRHVDLRAQHVRAVGELAARACAGTGRGSPPPAGRGRGCCGPVRSACRGTRGSRRRSGCRRTPCPRESAVRRTGTAARNSPRRNTAAAQSKPSQRTSSWIASTYSTSSFAGIGVVEAQVAEAAEFRGDAEVQADRLGMADVQVAVRLGRKPRVHTAAVPAGSAVLGDDFPDEIELCRGRRCPGVELHRAIICLGFAVTRLGVR